METNKELDLAYRFLQYTGTNVFLTGKAGTGKTTFLQQLKTKSPKRMVVLAPTGVAAINAGGVTIHSFFQLPFGPYVPGQKAEGTTASNRYSHRFGREKIDVIRSIDLLVIDEISMVRADLLDAVSDMLCRYRDRNRPFGGVQLLLIGDLQQLSPVVKEEEWDLLKAYYDSPFFFNSKALQQTSYISIELTYVYRQVNDEFIGLLNRIRANQVDEFTLKKLNSRYIPGFVPDDTEDYITLTTHNSQAQQINDRKLEEIGFTAYSYTAEIQDNFPAFAFPTSECLVLKKGAQVMFVKNDSSPEKRYYNGKIGKVTEIGPGRIKVLCRGDKEEIEVNREEWMNTKYSVDPETKEITEQVEGIFRQYPLKTAWAITIHKSQGLTFEHAIIEASAAFTHGQVYVALSRCKTLEGLVLNSPLSSHVMIRDKAVEYFTEQVGQNRPGLPELKEAGRRYYMELVTELFDYTVLWKKLQQLAWLFGEHLAKLYPDLTGRCREVRDCCYSELTAVGEKFQNQLRQLIVQSDDYEHDSQIQERIQKGVIYFEGKMEHWVVAFLSVAQPEIDNKEIRKTIEKALEALQREADVKMETLGAAEDGFSVTAYLSARAKAAISKGKAKAKSRSKSTTGTGLASDRAEISADIRHPELYKLLRDWRKQEADALKLPAYMVMRQAALVGICNLLPADGKELLKIPGIGKKVVEKYGAKIFSLIDDYRFGTKE